MTNDTHTAFRTVVLVLALAATAPSCKRDRAAETDPAPGAAEVTQHATEGSAEAPPAPAEALPPPDAVCPIIDGGCPEGCAMVHGAPFDAGATCVQRHRAFERALACLKMPTDIRAGGACYVNEAGERVLTMVGFPALFHAGWSACEPGDVAADAEPCAVPEGLAEPPPDPARVPEYDPNRAAPDAAQ